VKRKPPERREQFSVEVSRDTYVGIERLAFAHGMSTRAVIGELINVWKREDRREEARDLSALAIARKLG
jgi:hypothetical protein